MIAVIAKAFSNVWIGLKRYATPLLALAVVLVLLYGGYKWGARSANSEVATLTEKLAESEKTVELKQGLYATTLVQANDLQSLLTGKDAQVQALQKQLTDSQAQLLTTQQLVVQWKSAYQGALKATQTNGGATPTPVDGAVEVPVALGRTRVDFTGGLGPISATGYTLTNPPEAYLSLIQTRPLKLTVSVARERDGTWTSYVTSSEPNIGVNVSLGGVDPGVLAPSWYERIWVDGGIDFLGGKRASLGLSYRMDRWALGAGCSLETGWSAGCGLTAGFRLFK